MLFYAKISAERRWEPKDTGYKWITPPLASYQNAAVGIAIGLQVQFYPSFPL